jgi:site-specific recombinase XerD
MKKRAVTLVESFLEALASERGASLHTIEAYRRDLADYEAYLSAERTDARKAGSRTRRSPSKVRDGRAPFPSF